MYGRGETHPRGGKSHPLCCKPAVRMISLGSHSLDHTGSLPRKELRRYSFVIFFWGGGCIERNLVVLYLEFVLCHGGGGGGENERERVLEMKACNA